MQYGIVGEIEKLGFVEERDIMKLDYATGFYSISFFNINIETEEELTQDVLKKMNQRLSMNLFIIFKI